MIRNAMFTFPGPGTSQGVRLEKRVRRASMRQFATVAPSATPTVRRSGCALGALRMRDRLAPTGPRRKPARSEELSWPPYTGLGRETAISNRGLARLTCRHELDLSASAARPRLGRERLFPARDASVSMGPQAPRADLAARRRDGGGRRMWQWPHHRRGTRAAAAGPAGRDRSFARHAARGARVARERSPRAA